MKDWDKAKAEFEKAGKEAKKKAKEGDQADKLEEAIDAPKKKTGITPALRDLEAAIKEAKYIIKKQIPLSDLEVWMPTAKKIKTAKDAYGAGFNKLKSSMGFEFMQKSARGDQDVGVAYKAFTDAGKALVEAAAAIGKAINDDCKELMSDAGGRQRQEKIEASLQKAMKDVSAPTAYKKT